MSPSPDDASQAAEPKSAGGLSSVFKGLTSSKLARAPTLPAQSPTSPLAPEPAGAASPNAQALPPHNMEAFEQLKRGTLNERIAAANSLRYAIADYPLNPVLDIWYAGKDLIEPGKITAARHIGWELLAECAKHDSSTDLERKEFFQTLSARANPDDFHLQLAAVEDLTRKGRDLSGFDYDVIPTLTTWIVEVYKTVKAARKQTDRTRKGPKAKSSVTGEEKNLSQLFAFLLKVIKFNFKVADAKAVRGLISELLDLCMGTNSEEDLRSCIAVFNAIITFGAIPSEMLTRCVTVLSSIYCLVANLQKDSWHALANLCKSHHGQATVQILLDILRKFPPESMDEKEANREARGALAVLQKLITKSSKKGYPQVPLALLVDGIVNVTSNSSSPRMLASVLKLINSLFDHGDRKLNPMVVDEDWARILDVASDCAKKGMPAPTASDGNGTRYTSSTSTVSSKDDLDKGEGTVAAELKTLVTRIEGLAAEKRPDFVQRQDCIVFFTKVHHVLSDVAVGQVLDYFQDFRCCFPSDLQWESNLKLVVDSFYSNRRRSTLVRLRALQIITEVYDMLELVHDLVDEQCLPDLVKQILAGIAEENDTLLLQDTVTFLVSVAASADVDLFDMILGSLRGVVANDRLRSPISPPPLADVGKAGAAAASRATGRGGYCADQSPSNVVTRGYVQMFMRSVDTDAAKAVKTFDSLVHIARSNRCETDARLTAMRLLFRLRADWANRIFITPFTTESEGLASCLFRTEESLARKLAEDAAQASRQPRSDQQTAPSRPSRGASFTQGQTQERAHPVRSVSGAKPAGPKYQQLWALPDTDALPESPTATASPILFSHAEHAERAEATRRESSPTVAVLRMASWLEAIMSLIHNGCDWEVYSFILVHLPAQLSNHAIFRDAVQQIQDIRKLLCDQIRMNSFQEPPNSSGPRRPEVLMCLFHTLTMILSYHEHFQKSDEDEIVRTFIQGIADRTAICCVHALSICCHELPMSMSKSLVTILQRMSQIITRQGVAMHILEFLACLSRLPALYSNFREDEYRIVFGICFRYLQTVRDNRRSSSRLGSGGGGSDQVTPTAALSSGFDVSGQANTSDDLPEYVYALAYHVITFWFLALKLPDRANHVGWIASRLFTDNDGKQTGEEHAQVTMDFMQRVAYSDYDESAEDALFKERSQMDGAAKRWVIGHSIVTIQQAAGSGWALVTKRQPSGTACYTIRQTFRPVPSRSSSAENSREASQSFASPSLSSHLLLQLLSPIPQTYDSALRPILLPEDDVVERAIKVFDRNSTVDGHKVGVIYIGENQTEEAEILANVSGSSDYVAFLNGLGTLTKLKGATFNTQGLDREYDSDGQYMFYWRDRVTEMVFHVTTQMPTNLMHDPMCVNKKRHIGNDFVNIIFNDSGLPFKFDTFPSDFNYVNIVITPESRASFVASREQQHGRGGEGHSQQEQASFYKVQVMSKPGFPEISPAAETKMVSLRALPDFIRLLALNASVFSLVWSNREGGEHVSSWRNRLREINRLRERYGPKMVPTPSPPPTSLGGAMIGGPQLQQAQQQPYGADTSRPASSVRDSFSSLRRSSVVTFFTTTSEQTSHRSSILSTATTDNTEIMPMNGTDTLVDSLDFSKWA